MPVEPCTTNGKTGRRWGKEGKCYPCSDGNCAEAHRKAEAQGRAIAESAIVDEYASPGQAFARQARMETIILTLMGRSMKRFLADVTALAMKGGAAVSPVAVEDAWRAQIELALMSPLLSAEAIAYVHDAMIGSAIPVEAYTTVVTVYRASAEQHWGADETRNILRFSLSPDTATAEPVAMTASADDDEDLTAAGSPATAISRARKAAKALKRAHDIAARVQTVNTLREQAALAGIDYAGQSWWDKMRQEARDAVTGLEGQLTQTVFTSFVQQYSSADAKKRWVTRRDKKVRHTHKGADGQTVPMREAFRVGSGLLMYPGDRAGPIEEIANCRCVMVAVLPRRQPGS